jgi:hypothetical protein
MPTRQRRRWLYVRYDENKTAANLSRITSASIWVTTLPRSSSWKAASTCSAVTAQSGSGWNGDTMTFEGTSNGMGDPAGVRDTFAKRGPDGLTHTGEMQGPDKKWNKTDEEACHRH